MVPENEVGIFHLTLDDVGDVFELPECKGGPEINRNVYLVEGEAAKFNDKDVKRSNEGGPVMAETTGEGSIR